MRGGGNSWRIKEKEWRNNKTSNFFKFQIMREGGGEFVED